MKYMQVKCITLNFHLRVVGKSLEIHFLKKCVHGTSSVSFSPNCLLSHCLLTAHNPRPPPKDTPTSYNHLLTHVILHFSTHFVSTLSAPACAV